MGFLHKLWDETLAGPAPDSGLGHLRKCHSFSAARFSASHSSPPSASPAITRSITLLRTVPALRSISEDPGSGLSTPGTPSTPRTPDEKPKKFTKRKPPTEGTDGVQPGGPTDYDWVVMSALDR